MTAVADLLDQVRERANISSDNGLAERTGLKRQNIHQWRHGLAPIPDERIAQLCAIGKLDGPTWAAKIHAEKAQSPVERALWKSMLDRLSAAAAVVALIVLPIAGVKAENAVNSTAYQAPEAHSLYIMSGSTGTALCFHMHAASNAALSVTGGCCRRQELPPRA